TTSCTSCRRTTCCINIWGFFDCYFVVAIVSASANAGPPSGFALGVYFIVATCATPTPTPTPTVTPSCPPGALWYNGDFNGANALANEENTSLGSGQFASVYDNFIVPSGPAWTVTSVFSDNLSSTNITGAAWDIRQGVSEGNGGP